MVSVAGQLVKMYTLSSITSKTNMLHHRATYGSPLHLQATAKMSLKCLKMSKWLNFSVWIRHKKINTEIPDIGLIIPEIEFEI